MNFTDNVIDENQNWFNFFVILPKLSTIILGIIFFILGIVFSVVFYNSFFLLLCWLGGGIICLINYFSLKIILSYFILHIYYLRKISDNFYKKIETAPKNDQTQSENGYRAKDMYPRKETNEKDVTEITIPTDITSISNFEYRDYIKIKYINIPENITAIGCGSFLNCKSLETIEIPNSVKSIGESAFRNCKNLTDITLPDGLTSILYATFYGCANLVNVTIPHSITVIEDESFEGCSSLKDITIPNSVKHIGWNTFRDCTNLTNIMFNGTKEQWKKINKDLNWKKNVPTDCVVHCTDGDVNI